MRALAARARRWFAGRRPAFAKIEREGWKGARRSRAERDARWGGAQRVPRNAGSRRPLLRRAFTTAAAVMLGSPSLLACPQCFGAQETSMVDGTKLGVLVMLAITLAVQGGFVGFFFYLRKRAKRIADRDFDTEWSELQRASRTT